MLDDQAVVWTQDRKLADLSALDVGRFAWRPLRHLRTFVRHVLGSGTSTAIVRDLVWVVRRERVGIRCSVRKAGKGGSPDVPPKGRRADVELPVEAFAVRLRSLRDEASRQDGVVDAPNAVKDAGSVLGATVRHQALVEAMSPFLETLDPVALRNLLEEPTHPWGCYDGTDVTVTADAPLRRAVEANPGRSWLLRDAWLDGPAAFARAVEAGRLDEVLRRRASVVTRIPRSGMSTVDAVHDAVLGMATSERRWLETALPVAGMEALPGDLVPVEVCRLASRVVPSWRPRTARQAADFLAAAPMVAFAVTACRDPRDVSAMLDARGWWDGYASRVAPAETALGPWSARELTALVEDVTLSFARQVLEPAITSTRRGRLMTQPHGVMSEQVAAALLWSGRSLPRIAEVVRRWHEAESAIMTSVLALSGSNRQGPASWTPHLPDHAADGLVLVVLTDALQLVEEGARGPDREGMAGLSHCVGNYAPQCLSGSSRIASVRRRAEAGAWSRSSTVEFDVTGDQVRVLQHKGAGNRPAASDDVGLVGDYVSHLNGRTRSTRAVRPRVVEADGNGEAGYDVDVPGNWHAVAGLWRPFVPRGLRDLQAAEWDALAAIDASDPVRGQPDFGQTLDGHWRRVPYSRADLTAVSPHGKGGRAWLWSAFHG